MLKKRGSKDNLINSHQSCALFKKYYQYNLWFGNSVEYENIKYCQIYTQKYLYFLIHIFLFQRFSFSFVTFLYKSPCFIKFLRSGFFKYLDYRFLLLFYSNCFIFSFKGKQKIKNFIKLYFQIFIKKRFEKDLTTLIIKVINEILLNVLLKHLSKRLNNTQIYGDNIWLNNKLIFKLTTKKEIYSISLLLFFNKNSYYKLCFNILHNLYALKFVYKFLLKSINYRENNNLNINLKSVETNRSTTKNPSKSFSQKVISCCNKDVQHLLEAVNNIDGVNCLDKNIGLYKNFNNLSKKSFIQKDLLNNKYLTNFRLFLKSFNLKFVKYNKKRKFYSKFIIYNNIKFFNKFSKKKLKSSFNKSKNKLSDIIKKRFLLEYKNSLIENNKMSNYTLYNFNTDIFLVGLVTYKRDNPS